MKLASQNETPMKIVGLKDFRQNLSLYTKNAQEQNIRYVVLRKNVPVLEVRPLDEKKFAIESLSQELAEARDQIANNQYYTHEEVLSELGLL